MITTKYLIADLIQFIIQHLADERDEHIQHAAQLLIQAKNSLLSANILEQTSITDSSQRSREEKEITKAVDGFYDPSKNPIVKELQETLQNYENIIQANEEFQQAFQQHANVLEQETILQSLKDL